MLNVDYNIYHILNETPAIGAIMKSKKNSLIYVFNYKSEKDGVKYGRLNPSETYKFSGIKASENDIFGCENFREFYLAHKKTYTIIPGKFNIICPILESDVDVESLSFDRVFEMIQGSAYCVDILTKQVILNI